MTPRLIEILAQIVSKENIQARSSCTRVSVHNMCAPRSARLQQQHERVHWCKHSGQLESILKVKSKFRSWNQFQDSLQSLIMLPTRDDILVIREIVPETSFTSLLCLLRCSIFVLLHSDFFLCCYSLAIFSLSHTSVSPTSISFSHHINHTTHPKCLLGTKLTIASSCLPASSSA
jgi:hypothetical protein